MNKRIIVINQKLANFLREKLFTGYFYVSTKEIVISRVYKYYRFYFIYFIHLLVMESSEWPRTAIFAGVTTFFGNWAECLKSQGPGIRGQYCLPELRYDFSVDKTYDPPSPRWVDWPEEYESIWSIIQSVKFKDNSVLLINVLVLKSTIKF